MNISLYSMQMFGEIPFINPQNDTSTTDKRSRTMKNERKRLILFRIIQQSKCCLKRKALKLDLKDENDALSEREGEGIPHLSG